MGERCVKRELEIDGDYCHLLYLIVIYCNDGEGARWLHRRGGR